MTLRAKWGNFSKPQAPAGLSQTQVFSCLLTPLGNGISHIRGAIGELKCTP